MGERLIPADCKSAASGYVGSNPTLPTILLSKGQVMFQVYRVEHKTTKIGPFQTNDPFTQELAQKANNNPHLKFPCDDGLPLGFIPFCFVFGSLTLSSLQQWFCVGNTKEENEHIIHQLKEKGFILAEFLVEDKDCRVGYSQSQVAFDADSSKEEGLVMYHELDMLLI